MAVTENCCKQKTAVNRKLTANREGECERALSATISTST